MKSTLQSIIAPYPELDAQAAIMARGIIAQANHAARGIKSDMAYKAQYILEKTIAILEDCV